MTLTNWVEIAVTGNSRGFGGSFFPEAQLIYVQGGAMNIESRW